MIGNLKSLREEGEATKAKEEEEGSNVEVRTRVVSITSKKMVPIKREAAMEAHLMVIIKKKKKKHHILIQKVLFKDFSTRNTKLFLR